jgi:hypothetical protein
MSCPFHFRRLSQGKDPAMLHGTIDLAARPKAYNKHPFELHGRQLF